MAMPDIVKILVGVKRQGYFHFMGAFAYIFKLPHSGAAKPMWALGFDTFSHLGRIAGGVAEPWPADGNAAANCSARFESSGWTHPQPVFIALGNKPGEMRTLQ